MKKTLWGKKLTCCAVLVGRAEQGIKDKKLKATLKRQSQGSRTAAFEAVRSEILLPEQAGSLEAEGMERTYHFTQAAIKDAVDVTAGRKIFDLALPQLGPYAMRYTRNGRHVLIGGRKGHVATFDWKTGNLGKEHLSRSGSA